MLLARAFLKAWRHVFDTLFLSPNQCLMYFTYLQRHLPFHKPTHHRLTGWLEPLASYFIPFILCICYLKGPSRVDLSHRQGVCAGALHESLLELECDFGEWSPLQIMRWRWGRQYKGTPVGVRCVGEKTPQPLCPVIWGWGRNWLRELSPRISPCSLWTEFPLLCVCIWYVFLY